jgi:serine/threonine protein kinase/Tfp pilus assembly protein PilF
MAERVGKNILHYKLIKQVGQGGMGIVYLAEDTKLERQVAIKFLTPHIASNSDVRKRFQIEAKAAASLNHPNIATIYAIEEAENEIFLVMEYIQGKELKDVIHTSPLARRQEMGGIGISNALDYSIQIARGLQAAHQKNIIHRDIKSGNIMVTDNGDVKIMDFGLAVCKNSLRLTSVGTTVGTAAYMSPEQALGKNVDERTDIWSLGVVLYEMLSGKLPFKGDYEQAVIYNVLNEDPQGLEGFPENMSAILKKLLAKNPDNRFQSMAEVSAALNEPKGKAKPSKDKNQRPSIAVLPFKDMSPARDQDYFCEGVAEEILNSLNKINDLHVTSRTSSFLIKKEEKDIREIGHLLNVNSVLEGSVRKAGNMLRINVQLINVVDGYYLWSKRYDRELNDIFAVQDDIAENVATELRGVLTIEEKEAIHHSATVIKAYELFLKGRQFLNQLLLDEARELFEKAHTIDPEYVPCLASLADAHAWSYEWKGSAEVDLQSAYNFSGQALKLGPDYAESHVSRGYVLSLDQKYNEAENEFLEAIRINPNLFDIYYLYGRSCFARGEIKKSADLFKKASETDQFDSQSVILLAQSYSVLGLKEASFEAYQEGIKRAEQQLKLDPLNARALSLGSHAWFFTGQQEKGFEWIKKAMKHNPENQSVLTNYACLLAVSGQKDEAIDVLEKLYQKGYGKKSWIMNDPDYDSLRDHPRFKKLLKKLK